MEQPLRGIVGVHGGRMYYNLTNIHSILRMAPFGESLARAFNQFVGATEVTAPRTGALKWSDARNAITAAAELLRIGVHRLWQYAVMRRRLEVFERTADAFAARTHPDRLQTQPLPELLDELRAFLVSESSLEERVTRRCGVDDLLRPPAAHAQDGRVRSDASQSPAARSSRRAIGHPTAASLGARSTHSSRRAAAQPVCEQQRAARAQDDPSR